MTIASTPQPTAAKRPTLASLITRGRIKQPLRVLLYGPEGIGKSTFGAAAPAPVFLCPEDGTALLDVARLPEPKSWTEALELVRALHEPHDFQTLVLDTLDWLEPLCWRHVCEKHKKTDIEAFGYGKGYLAALDEWRGLLSELDRLRHQRRMSVVLLAHAWIKPYKNPEGDDYDRFNLKVHDKAGGLVKEWVDAALFANYETLVDSTGNRPKGLGGGARWVHTQRRAAFDAKNRFNLPETLPLSWDEFTGAIAAAETKAAADASRGRIATALAELGDAEIEAKVKGALEGAGDDPARLAVIENRLAATIAGKRTAP